MGISAPGLGSSLDVNGIVSQLMAVERRPITLLDSKEAGYQAQLSAYGSLKGALSKFQDSLTALANPNAFTGAKAVVGDAKVLTATAAQGAEAGAFEVNVTQLAQAHKVASNAYADLTSSVGTGTLNFQFGTYDGVTNTFTANAARPAKTVSIGPGQDSLAGVRDAINAADAGVKASIVNDGTGQRLVLASISGAANSLKITVSDADGNATDTAGLSALAYDPTAAAGAGRNLTQTLAARDALLTIDGLVISSPSNAVEGALAGVNLKLGQVGATTLTVAADTQAGKSAVEVLVKNYNDLHKTFSDLTRFDPASRSGGPLVGDAAVRTLRAQIRAEFSQALGDGPTRNLAGVGLSFQKDGTLKLDGAKLQSALDADAAGVGALFATAGRASDSLVRYAGAGEDTPPGEYALSVSQLAAQGRTAGAQAANLTIGAGLNDQLTLSLDGESATVTLAAGTYTTEQLTAEVQSRINAAFDDRAVSVSHAAGVFTLTSDAFGADSAVAVTGGNGADDLLGAGRTAQAGADVAGTFNGAAATGSGRTLTDAGGLKVEILGGLTGARGTVTFGRGLADRLGRLLDAALDGDGAITARTEGINRSIKDVGLRRETLERRMETIESRLRAQFTALDTLVSSLTTTSNFLTQQLASLPGSGT